MKITTPCRVVGTLSMSLLILAGSLETSHSEITAPRGTLNVDKDLVRVSTRSNLDWEIEYPAAVTDIVTVDPTGTITPKENLKMKVRVLGAAFQSGRNLLPVAGYWSFNKGGWQNFFFGTSLLVNSSSVLISKDVTPSDTIDFGARGARNTAASSWYNFNNTTEASQYLTVLANGATAPAYAPAYNQDSVTSFLKPYINADGTVNIGERDLIILWECSSASINSSFFDMQDLVVLVSFE